MKFYFSGYDSNSNVTKEYILSSGRVVVLYIRFYKRNPTNRKRDFSYLLKGYVYK